MRNIYIFGTTPFAEMLSFYVQESQDSKFCGYVVDDTFLPPDGVIGEHPVYSWSHFVSTVSPSCCEILSSVTYGNMNSTREVVYNRIKNAGYTLGNYIHPSAVVASNCRLGEGNIILEQVTIQPFTVIGNNNVFWSNVNICHHSTIGNYNFFAASSAVLGKITIKDRCFIGCNATIRNRTVIESDTLIGASAYLDRSTVANSVIVPPRSIELDKKSFEIHL